MLNLSKREREEKALTISLAALMTMSEELSALKETEKEELKEFAGLTYKEYLLEITYAIIIMMEMIYERRIQ